jgi:aldehyde:ferredoxin oxidoreductase
MQEFGYAGKILKVDLSSGKGVLREAEPGLPLSKTGSAEFIEALVKKISFREGFGDLLARGMIKTAEAAGKMAQDLLCDLILTRANEARDYDPRLILTNALLYAISGESLRFPTSPGVKDTHHALANSGNVDLKQRIWVSQTR